MAVFIHVGKLCYRATVPINYSPAGRGVRTQVRRVGHAVCIRIDGARWTSVGFNHRARRVGAVIATVNDAVRIGVRLIGGDLGGTDIRVELRGENDLGIAVLAVALLERT